MKKAVSIILACCMLLSLFVTAVSAETDRGSADASEGADVTDLEAALAAVGDKLDPSVILCLNNPSGNGRYFEIQYHGVSQSELLALIGAICDYELVNVDIGEGKVAVGLPYYSIVSIAGLDSVEYISLFTPTYNSKIAQSLQVKLDQVNYGDKTSVGVFLYCTYDEAEIFRQAIKECGYVGGLPLNMTLEEVYAYKAVYNRLVSEQEAAVASSFVEKLGIADEDIIYLGKHSYVFANLTKAQIINAAQMNEVESIYRYEDSPIEAPTEAPTEAPPEPGNLYRERLKEYYNLCEYDEDPSGLMGYQELYYHRDGNSEIDWALIQCCCNIMSPIEYTAIVGNRVLHPGTEYYPFSTTYGIYDVKNDKFVGANSKAAYGYDDFIRAFDETAGSGMGWSMADIDNQGRGKPLGDIDNDDELSIVDVTFIQRCEAMMMEYPASDAFEVTYDYGVTHYYSDFNLDGERDIRDATCIQRYLVGMYYPIG